MYLFRYFPNGNFKILGKYINTLNSSFFMHFILGQCDAKLGEFNARTEVRKQMIVSGVWWRKPETVTIVVKEFQLYDLTPLELQFTYKRRLLCKSSFLFFTDEDEDSIEKVTLTITDAEGDICFHKTYSKVDRINRRFFTNQYVFSYFPI